MNPSDISLSSCVLFMVVAAFLTIACPAIPSTFRLLRELYDEAVRPLNEMFDEDDLPTSCELN